MKVEDTLKKVLDKNHIVECIESYHKVTLKHIDCGNVYTQSMNEIKRGVYKCKKCFIRGHEKTIKELISEEDDSYSLLSDFTRMHDRVKMLHKTCGKVSDITLYSFLTLHGSRCECIKADKKVPISDEEFSLYLDNFYKSSFKLVGSNVIKDIRCGHEYEIVYEDFIKGRKICKCCNNMKNYQNLRKTTEHVSTEIKLLTSDGYSLLSKYVNNKTKVEMLHKKCGKRFLVRTNDFISSDNRCPHCKVASKLGNRFIHIKKLIDDMFETLDEYTFDDCKYKKVLPFDTAILKDNQVVMLIEFHGDQHYKNSFNNDKKFKDQQIRDGIKVKYAKEKGIPLLIIPYNTKTSPEEYLSIIHNMI